MFFPEQQVRVFLYGQPVDMRRSYDGLHALARHGVQQDPLSGHLFAFRGKNATLLKILFWDGNGLCLFTKRLDRGQFVWPRLTEHGSTVTLSAAQLAMLIEGIDWRNPERTWRPKVAV